MADFVRIVPVVHLVANCLIFHNVYAMTQALHKMVVKELRFPKRH